jgi:hypothetical protein
VKESLELQLQSKIASREIPVTCLSAKCVFFLLNIFSVFFGPFLTFSIKFYFLLYACCSNIVISDDLSVYLFTEVELDGNPLTGIADVKRDTVRVCGIFALPSTSTNPTSTTTTSSLIQAATASDSHGYFCGCPNSSCSMYDAVLAQKPFTETHVSGMCIHQCQMRLQSQSDVPRIGLIQPAINARLRMYAPLLVQS